jgi:signal transduction histidine kinase
MKLFRVTYVEPPSVPKTVLIRAYGHATAKLFLLKELTQMNAIKGFTNFVLRRDKSMEDRSWENLQKVSQASDHLLAMINDLLDLSKIEAGRMDVTAERFDVKDLIASCCDTVSPLIQEGVVLRQEVAEDVGEANTDRARVQQMVINLLSNAIKFTESGSVVVTAQREKAEVSREKENLVSASPVDTADRRLPTAHTLLISVSDTGKGIPADELPTIFDEYRQAEGSESSVQKGTGLGLSITRKFAELLGGSIVVESGVGKGSTFTVSVPVDYEDSSS